MSLNKKPLTHYRQPLLATSPAPSRKILLAAGALLVAAAGWTLGRVPDLHEQARMAGPSATPGIQEGVVSSVTSKPQPTAEQIRQAAVERRKQILAQRIASTYRRPLADVRTIVDGAHASGRKHQVDPVLLLAIAAVESSFDPQAVSSVGAQGLLQALPRAHPEKFDRIREEGKSPFDPVVSMDLGGQIYAEYRDRFDGNRILALQQYNGNLKDKTHRYSNKVLRAYDFLSSGLPQTPMS